MSYENPTRLRIGMHGNFEGKDYRVVGRSVLGELEDGETYFWNEFNLETKSGEEATLVYEETERGGEWRLFTQFEPEYPMTAADAATKNVGDRLNLTGDDVSVTFRSTSEVYYVEGKAPEGEAVGATAEYFNAESGSLMQVVSWTGDEVEFYWGQTVTRGLVAAAFGLPQELETSGSGRTFSSFSGSSSGNYKSSTAFILQAAFVIILFLIIFGRGFSFSTNYETGPVKKMPAAAQPLYLGATGTLFNKNYRATAHAVVEIDEVGSKWERHEYELTDDSGAKALLVCGDKPGGDDWIFFEPFFPTVTLTAKQAAAKQVGDPVDLEGYPGTVSGIFECTIEQPDGTGLDGLQNGAVSYGFWASDKYQMLLVRWNDAGIQFFRGQTITAKKGMACFAAAK